MNQTKELPIPTAAKSDERAIELVRVWVADGEQHVSIATGIWNDPAAWGMMLVDLARHIACAFEQTEGRNRGETLARIRAGFDAEWVTATDMPGGNVLS